MKSFIRLHRTHLLTPCNLKSKFNHRYISSVKLAYAEHHPRSGETNEPPLVVLHGLFGSRNNWQSLCKKFAENLHTKVVAVDARNHGESPHTQHMDYPLMADDVVDLLDSLKIEQAHLLGHSMGGKTAMTLALRHPHLLKSLIIEDVTPVTSPNSGVMYQYIKGLKGLDLRLNGEKITQLRRKVMVDSDLVAHVPSMGIRTFLLQNLVSDSQSDSARWRCNLDSISDNLQNILAWDEDAVLGEQYTRPTRFIGGANSPYLADGKFPEEDKDVIKGYFPSAEFHIVQDAGHWIHSEQPVKFSQLVCQFIKQVNDVNT